MQRLVLTYGIVHGLVDRWTHPTPIITQCRDLRYLKGGIVTQSQFNELSLLMHLVDFFQGFREGY